MMAIELEQSSGHGRSPHNVVVFATALTMVMYGMDNQLIVYTIPALMKDWSLPAFAFRYQSPVTHLGILLGGLLGGLLGDTIGRRRTLLWSVITFALSTLAIAFVNGVPIFLLLRFLSGFGFGGAIVNSVTLAFEHVPMRAQAFAVILTMACVSIGGTVGSYMAGLAPGGRTLVVLGGAIPLIFTLLLYLVVPESPQYSARSEQRTAFLRKPAQSDAVSSEPQAAHPGESKKSIGDIFIPAFQFDTLGLFGAFLFALLANYIVIWLLPVTLVTGGGFSRPSAVGVLSTFSIGGIAGALLVAALMRRFGSRFLLVGMSACSIGCAITLAAIPIDPEKTFLLFLMVALLGGLLNATQTALYVVAANMFAPEIRATGLGMALAVGRLGVFLSALGESAALRGVPAFFGTVAVVMTLTLGSVALIRRHWRVEA